MKAAVFNRYGGNDVVELKDMPVPVPGPAEVVVKVHAASVNPVDWKVRYGQARILTGSKFPKVLGCECAGEVSETGIGATKFRKGDRIVMYTSVKRLGAFAEYACTTEATVYPIPEGVTYEQAACLPIAGLTALQSLRNHGKIAAGKKVLINGASGGVGHFAVQIAKVFGAEVTGVCSSRNADFVKGLGADRVIDYGYEDFTRGGERYDLIFDAVSRSSFWYSRRVLAPRGVYVSTLPNATIVAQIVTTLLPGRKARQMWVKPNARDMEWMMDQIKGGKVKVVIDHAYPLDRITDALAASEAGRTRGKIVVTIA
ncbi:MAG: NAD(P)-dependent alcohol dehydrogenase [Nitrospirae bacterium]|nr:NAD(P)-dependent alcohol dehydrogenase [Nitrospirota bacterium]NTW65754.1 NAD(P)-dependent alcohol dehydrogenase [Nitrospirota bacterium]